MLAKQANGSVLESYLQYVRGRVKFVIKLTIRKRCIGEISTLKRKNSKILSIFLGDYV